MEVNRVIEDIISQIKQEVLKPNMTQIPLAYLQTRKIPDSVKHFFDQEVESWLREEQESVFSSDRFDYDMPEVRMLLDQVFDTLKNTATFSEVKFNQLVERALKLEANYTISPHRTLKQFLFKDKPIISTIEVYDLLRYFTKFNYYKDALTKYFNLKYMKEISEPQFAELISQIDSQVFTKDPIQSILKISKSIINFLNQGREPEDSLDIKIIVEAFEDRSLQTHAKLMNALLQRGFKTLTMEELENILTTGQMPQKPAEEEMEAEVEAEVETAEEPAEEETVEAAPAAGDLKARLKSKLKLETSDDMAPSVEVDSISVPDQSQMLEQLIEDEEEEVVDQEYDAVLDDEEEEEVIEETVDAGSAEEDAQNQLADLVSKKLAADQNALPSIRALIGPKDKKKLIKRLFKKNTRTYDKLIKLLEDTASWKQASLIIDNQFYENGINPYSKEAIEFSDIIYNRYFVKEQEMQKTEFD